MVSLLFSTFLIFLSACSSIKTTLPPTSDEIKKIKYEISKEHKKEEKKKETQSISWATNYLQARNFDNKNNFDAACLIYKKLSEEKSFPLRELSFLKSLTSCKYSAEELDDLWKKSDDLIPTWLKEQYINISLQLAEKLSLDEEIGSFSFKLSKFGRLQHEKIRLLNIAIEKATDSGQSTTYRNRLYAVAPHLNPDINEDNIEAVAKDFEKNRFFDRARELYQKIINDQKSSFSEQISFMNKIAMTYKLERNLETFRNKVKEISDLINLKFQNNPTNEEYKNALIANEIKLARALWTNDKDEEAKKILLNVLKQEPTNADTRATILNTLGGISLESRDLELAIIYFKEALLSSEINQELKDNLCWNVGWIYYKLKNYESAKITFLSCQETSLSSAYKIKVKFWEARSMLLAHEEESANELFSEVVIDDEYGYYGIMAQKELGQPFSPLQRETQPQAVSIPTFEWLISMGESDLGRKFLEDYVGKKKSAEIRLKTIPLFARAHAYDLLIQQFYNLDETTREQFTGEYINLIFPMPLPAVTKKAASKFGVDPAFMYAIARQESSFNVVARSFADAFGIMQIIPERAAELSKRYSIPYTDYKSLFNETTNIYLGTALLKEMLNKYHGNMVLATASYNASEMAINQWLRDRYSGDMIEFIEMIPYQETNNYVKLVLRNFINYKRLSADEDFIFPETILKYKDPSSSNIGQKK